jgi:predicted permease
MLARLRSLLRALVYRRRFEHDMAGELEFHITQYTEDLVRSGLPPAEAARRARLEFGARNTVEENCRHARGLHPFDELARQLRYATRLFRKTPAFTATALATLALCLGANLTIFAALDAIVLRPLPFPSPARLVTIFNTYPKAGVLRDGSSIANYYERRNHVPAFSSLALYQETSAIAGFPGATAREPVSRITPDFFTTLGRGPAIGRSFTDRELTFQTDNVAILTDQYRRRYFSTPAQAIGRQIPIDGVPHTIIGVLPPDFRFLSSESRLYLPLSSNLAGRGSRNRHSGGNSRQLIARLRPGATLAQAQAQIDAQNHALETQDPQAAMIAAAGFRSLVVPLHADHIASIRPTLLGLQAGALVLLLIGAVNLANLLLIRAAGRARETAVRHALGASRARLLAEVLLETSLLTLTGAILGIAAGAAGIRLLSTLGADRLPLGAQIAFNPRLAATGLLAALALGLVLAAPVAWFNLRAHLSGAVSSQARGGSASHAAQRLRHAFVIAQIALTLVLLSTAGLLSLSLERAAAVPPGFRPDHVLTGQLSFPGARYRTVPALLEFNQRLLASVAHQPGVLAAGTATNIPLSGNSGKSAATVEGYQPRPGESPRGHYSYSTDGDYFQALGFSLLEGRFLTAADSLAHSRVCVVDHDFARYYFPHQSALGHRLFEGSEPGPASDAFTIVGVVSSVKQASLTDPSAQGAIYYPFALRPDGAEFIAIRAALPPSSLAPALEAAVRRIDPELPVTNLRSMQQRIGSSLIPRRSPALLAALFAAIALLLTAIGTYGVLSYSVLLRRGEIGVRMALGARPSQIRRHFLALSLRLLAPGAILGLSAAALANRAIRSLLFNVAPLNAPTLAAALALITLTALAACLIPAHRASRISPRDVLTES